MARKKKLEPALRFIVRWGVHLKGPPLQREYYFHSERRWRFDYAIPEIKVAIEIEGGTKGRHQRIIGFTEDCEKYNAAGLLGWTVFRFSTLMVDKEDLIRQVIEFCQRKL